MKRLLRVFAFLGSVGVIGWLVRNRVVAVTMNREPQKPEPAPEPLANVGTEDSLTRIDGIGPAEAETLGAAGVATAADLAKADAADLAARTGVDQALLNKWMEQAAAVV